jgi:hypothetical protein
VIPVTAWTAACAHSSERVYVGLAPAGPALVSVAVVCGTCRRLGEGEVKYPAPTFAGRIVGAG